MAELYIGLMSGTSADGIDAVLVDFAEQPRMVASLYTAYTDDLRRQIFSLCETGENEIQRLAELDVILAKAFAATVKKLLHDHHISADAIQAIGSHGHTIRHAPRHTYPYTLQIGDPNVIAFETGITTVADFRRKDIALGGQGAPLVPAFHQHVFSSEKNHRAIVNIGGIANVTLLPADASDIVGFDTGPGNTLLDSWIYKHQQEKFDKHGQWGQTGKVHKALLNNLLADDFFLLPPPKSTGREYFNLCWLEKNLPENIAPVDVQATLTELTALTIISAIQNNFSHGEILICGGGAHNQFLISLLSELAGSAFQISSTQQHGIDPDWVEAFAFAWLAKQTLHRIPGNLPSVTGASKPSVLGGIYYPD
jgi:anhydro-N-acetylmuramic acid kinase